MSNFIMSHWASYMLLFTTIAVVGSVQWMRYQAARSPKQDSNA